MSGNDKKARSREERDAERDSFWDLESMLPQKKTARPQPSSTRKIELSDIIVPEKSAEHSAQRDRSLQLSFDTSVRMETGVEPLVREPDKKADHQFERVKRFIPPYTGEQAAMSESPLKVYSPQNTMIHKVSVYAWRPRFSYYDRFAAVAATLYNKTIHTPCDPVDFFSYVPNYTHLSREQLSWYIYWRTKVHEGQFPDVSYSYILLYVYELLAVIKELGAETVRERMLAVWCAYRNRHTKLDKFMGDWICDISLVHELPAPTLDRELFEAVMEHCTLKEYYIPDRGNDYRAYSDIIVKYCSSYDYTKSKFYNGDATELYDKHIHRAIEFVMQRFSDAGKLFSAIGLTDSWMHKDTFVGAVCTCDVKRKVEVEYCSFSGTNNLRHAVGDMVKYCENRLRAYLGIKSRFSAVPMHPEARKAIDYYFDTELPGISQRALSKKQREEAARESEYSHLYDLPQNEFSTEKALLIESESWQTTEMLTEAFEGEPTINVASEAPQSLQSVELLSDESCTEELEMLSVEENDLLDMPRVLKEFLAYVYFNDIASQQALAGRLKALPDTVAEQINEFALEAIGDILIEEGEDGKYMVIDDYMDTVRPIAIAYKTEKRTDND